MHDFQGESDGAEFADPGLANERTFLAWNRTALALGAIGALMIRASVGTAAEIPGIAAGTSMLVTAASAWGYGFLVYQGNQRALMLGGHVARPHALRIVSIATTVTAVAAFLVALFP